MTGIFNRLQSNTKTSIQITVEDSTDIREHFYLTKMTILSSKYMNIVVKQHFSAQHHKHRNLLLKCNAFTVIRMYPSLFLSLLYTYRFSHGKVPRPCA
jgi:hypothetical protein